MPLCPEAAELFLLLHSNALFEEKSDKEFTVLTELCETEEGLWHVNSNLQLELSLVALAIMKNYI